MIQILRALTVYLRLTYQKFLSRLGLSVQQLFQLVQLNLLGAASLEDLRSPKRRKNDNPFNLRLLSLVSLLDSNVLDNICQVAISLLIWR